MATTHIVEAGVLQPVSVADATELRDPLRLLGKKLRDGRLIFGYTVNPDWCMVCPNCILVAATLQRGDKLEHRLLLKTPTGVEEFVPRLLERYQTILVEQALRATIVPVRGDDAFQVELYSTTHPVRYLYVPKGERNLARVNGTFFKVRETSWHRH